MFFWNREQFGLSQILVCINSFAHLYAVTQLPDISERNALTHWVVKTTAGIGLLDLIDNGGVYLVSLKQGLQVFETVMTSSLEIGCASDATCPDPGRWFLRCRSKPFLQRARTSD